MELAVKWLGNRLTQNFMTLLDLEFSWLSRLGTRGREIGLTQLSTWSSSNISIEALQSASSYSWSIKVNTNSPKANWYNPPVDYKFQFGSICKYKWIMVYQCHISWHFLIFLLFGAAVTTKWQRFKVQSLGLPHTSSRSCAIQSLI